MMSSEMAVMLFYQTNPVGVLSLFKHLVLLQ